MTSEFAVAELARAELPVAELARVQIGSPPRPNSGELSYQSVLLSRLDLRNSMPLDGTHRGFV